MRARPSLFIWFAALLTLPLLFPSWELSAFAEESLPPSNSTRDPAPGSEDIELLSQLEGPASALAVQGTYTYLGTGQRLTILDTADPTRPTLISKSDVLSGTVEAIEVAESYAYVTAANTLYIFDVSSPSQPVQTASLDFPDVARKIAVAGTNAFVAVGTNVYVVDVSDPAAPEQTAAIPGTREVLDVEARGNHVHIVDKHWRIVDVTNPSDPQVVHNSDTGEFEFREIIAIALSGNYAYLVSTPAEGRYGDNLVGVVDVSDPSEPQGLGGFTRPGALGVTPDGHRIYVYTYAGLHIYDATDPENLRQVGYSEIGVSEMAVADNRAYVLSGGLRILDVTLSDEPPLESLGNYGDGARAVYNVAVSGEFAYAAVRDVGLQIVSLADPSQPVEMGRYETANHISEITVAGSYLYLNEIVNVDNQLVTRLRILDVRDPSRPVARGVYTITGWLQDIVVGGNYVYLTDGNRLQVLDASNPAAPMLIGTIDTPGAPYALELVGEHLFVAERERTVESTGSRVGGGLRVLDVSNPRAPREVGYLAGLNTPTHIAVIGDYAYFQDSSTGLNIVNVSDPASPRLESRLPGTYADDFAVAGNYVYLLRNGNHRAFGYIKIVDVSDPANPLLVDQIDLGYTYEYNMQVAAHENQLYIVGVSLYILRVNSFVPVRELGVYHLPSGPTNVTAHRSHAYLLDNYGLQVVDLSAPAAPRGVGRVRMREDGSPRREIGVSQNRVYVAAHDFSILDVTIPSRPWQIGNALVPAPANGLALAGQLAFIAVGSEGVVIHDVANAVNPVAVGSYQTPGFAWDVAVVDHLAYVADGGAGLHILDVSDPAHPTRLGGYDTPGFAYEVAVSGRYAYIADGPGGLRIFDVSDPTAPQPIAVLDGSGSVDNLAVEQNLLYYLDAELHVVNVADPTYPDEVAFFDLPDDASDLSVYRNHIYAVSPTAGLFTLRYQGEDAPAFFDVYLPSLNSGSGYSP